VRTTIEIRKRAVEAYANGLSIREAGAAFGVSGPAVHRWIRLYAPEVMRRLGEARGKKKKREPVHVIQWRATPKALPRAPSSGSDFIAPIPLSRLMGARA